MCEVGRVLALGYNCAAGMVPRWRFCFALRIHYGIERMEAGAAAVAGGRAF